MKKPKYQIESISTYDEKTGKWVRWDSSSCADGWKLPTDDDFRELEKLAKEQL